ncbi:MAG: 1-deoxy-D-xylulose-5-phosphate reductoisomerase, partial [Bacteroidales bacterium]|nr:1-deoxy-D-xylulose-5-phosphate reductoisomerase [Bacteroidales bacterium]
MKTRIAILGSTGSIGRQTLDVVRLHPDRFEVALLTARSSSELLIKQALEFKPDDVVICDPSKWEEVRRALSGTTTEVHAGMDSVCGLVT